MVTAISLKFEHHLSALLRNTSEKVKFAFISIMNGNNPVVKQYNSLNALHVAATLRKSDCIAPPSAVQRIPLGTLALHSQHINNIPVPGQNLPNVLRASLANLHALGKSALGRADVCHPAIAASQDITKRLSNAPKAAVDIKQPSKGVDIFAAEEFRPDKSDPSAGVDENQESVLVSKKRKNKDTMYQRGLKRSNESDYGHIPKRARPYDLPAPSRSNRTVQRPPVKAPTGAIKQHEYELITEAITKLHSEKQQEQSLYEKKMKLRDALYAVFKNVFPYCGLYIVGSSMSGFGSQSSDMDMCLMLSHCDIDQKKEATEILRILFRALKNCSFLKELQLIRAKVPILKFKDKYSGVECDLNINNSVGIRNTHLLNCYCKLDDRLGPLILFVKHWAKSQNINDASQGTISSYSLVLMVIHYLQYGCSPPVLPSLQQMYPHKFNAGIDIRVLTLNEALPQYTSQNQMALGELFVGFLQYYTHTFDFYNCAMSIRLGEPLSKEVAMMQNPTRNPPGQWKYICIEEPFDLSNTARSVYDEYIFQKIKRVFRQSFTFIRMTGQVSSVLENPL